jgi:general secretion pathway protein E
MSEILPFAFARDNNILLENGVLQYGELPNIATLTEIGRTHSNLRFEQIPETEIKGKIQKFYESVGSQSFDNINNESEESLTDLAEDINKPIELLDGNDEAPIIRLLNSIFAEAILKQASDIHIEPYEDRMRIRLRVNGTLKQILEPSRRVAPLIVSRVKVMAKLDIAERRIPQDGRIAITLSGRAVDMRVSTIPSANGEKVVMRLLDKEVGRLQLSTLGMNDDAYQKIIELIKRPHGIILVTGPTGSGKTTTLYAALGLLNDNQRNLMTVEDPIEYHIDGINQTGINQKVDMTFAKGLRAILRQDPDVIMVGEIRDSETAQISIQASLTGHLVLSTLHTNTAIGAITRLGDMGVEPFLLASSLNAVLAQRLVRKLCECKTIKTTDSAEMQKLGITNPQEIATANGCEKCGYSGYSGRKGLYELVVIDDEARSIIHTGGGENDLLKHFKGKYSSLDDQAKALVLDGETSLDEVIRVVLSK